MSDQKTLRDEFAIEAMKACLSRSLSEDIGIGIIAKLSYEIADAMLFRRNESQGAR